MVANLKKNDQDNLYSWPNFGNQPVVDFLNKIISQNRISQAYIFAGPENLGKSRIAQCFAKNILLHDSHSSAELLDLNEDKLILTGDVHILRHLADKRGIGIEQVRELIKTLEMSSFSNSYKIGIIDGAESMSIEAMNALLKILEEPKAKVVLILVAANLEALPKTIVSRAQVLNFYPVRSDIIQDFLIKDYNASPTQAKGIAHLSLGRPALAVKFLSDSEFYDNYLRQAKTFLSLSLPDPLMRWSKLNDLGKLDFNAAVQTLNSWEAVARDLLLINSGQVDLIRHEVFRSDLVTWARRLSDKSINQLLSALRQANSYLAANVQPAAVFEYLFSFNFN